MPAPTSSRSKKLARRSFALGLVVLTVSSCSLDWSKKKQTEEPVQGTDAGTRDAGGGDGGDGRGDGGDLSDASDDTLLTDAGNMSGDDAGPGPVCDQSDPERCASQDECAALPCKNGGTCADGAGAYVCTCPAGFAGATCETNRDECAATPCKNGGTCADGANSFTCSCPVGFQGETCELNNNDCSPNPCRNGGSCKDMTNGFMCTCAAGYSGSQCETNINECASNPCQNGGTCKDGVNAFSCTCPKGYSGSKCETNINECAPNPCQNGGTCTDKVNDYSCACPADKLGKQCELRVCGDLSIDTKAVLDANRLCAEIRGELQILTGTTGAITASDFPYLTKITGGLFIGIEGQEGLSSIEVTLPALQTIGGQILFYASKRVTALRFPSLRAIGGNFGLMAFSAVKSLDFPALTVIGGGFSIENATALCLANFSEITAVSGGVGISNSPRLPPSALRPMFMAATESSVTNLGCCFGPEAVQCDRAYEGEECRCN